MHNGKLFMGVLGDPVAGATLLYVSEDPENSGWSFTRYFFPTAFNDGQRLESEP